VYVQSQWLFAAWAKTTPLVPPAFVILAPMVFFIKEKEESSFYFSTQLCMVGQWITPEFTRISLCLFHIIYMISLWLCLCAICGFASLEFLHQAFYSRIAVALVGVAPHNGV
jgi:hypothetical protein